MKTKFLRSTAFGLLFILQLFVLTTDTKAQCADGMSQLELEFTCNSSDCAYSYYVYSVDFSEMYGSNSFMNNPTATDQICIPSDQCLLIYLYYDGFDSAPTITYSASIDGVPASSGEMVGWYTQFYANCPAGSMCGAPITLETEGTYTADLDDTWYVFAPSITGLYHISTCNDNTCDTKIWVYENCPFGTAQEGPPGTYAYNDNGNCGTQADTDVIFEGGNTYYIRIGDNMNACVVPVTFTLSYVGQIPGCMDPNACNYNPLAQVEAPCLYYPDPNCTGPDLMMNVDVLLSSMTMMNVQAMNCDVVEGMVTGDGMRDVITFSVRIDNIGTADYYIGDPTNNPEMFELVNCHGHTHYAGYGDYRLMDMQGNIIPAGHKNGFCVMDLCGFGQYNCGQMGISAGCYDEYGAGTSGQWFDITDVPDGTYRGLVTVNPLELPDALGRHEMDYENNTYVFCLEIYTNNQGSRAFQLSENCPPFVDCAGVEGGTATPDCEGVCNGPSVWGDIVSDNDLNQTDLDQYIDILSQEEIIVTTCNDLSANGSLTIYDLSLANSCIGASETSASSQCYFPHNVISTMGSAGLAISDVNFEEGYIDVEIKSQMHAVVAYQFNIGGVIISSVESLADGTSFPCSTGFNPFTNDVFGLGEYETEISPNINPQALIRIYYSQITSNTICINGIIDIVNDQRSRLSNYVYGNCFDATAFSTNEIYHAGNILVRPNPAQDQITFSLTQFVETPRSLIIRDHIGKIVQVISLQNNNHVITHDISSLPSGLYTIESEGNDSIKVVTRFTKL
ncbi:MAG: hypothetical protein K1X54_04415 [Flavobacteriales bacterium]|nr:hypothetical protein [Flavobacteriales bacterium]